MLRLLMKVSGKSNRPLAVPGWSPTRDFPPLAETTFKQWWEDDRQRGEGP